MLADDVTLRMTKVSALSYPSNLLALVHETMQCINQLINYRRVYLLLFRLQAPFFFYF